MPPSRQSNDGSLRCAAVALRTRAARAVALRTHAARVVARFRSDDGSASLEFITAGMILLLPLVYLVVALSTIQAAAFSTEGAARQAARVFVQAGSADAATAAAGRAVQFALDDYGLSAAPVETAVTCAPEPDECLTRSGTVTVTVRVAVTLPLVPQALDFSAPLSVPIEASATQVVSRFRTDG